MSAPAMKEIGSDNYASFGFEDFDENRLAVSNLQSCPMKGCAADLDKIERRANKAGKARKPFAFCSVHGIRLHPKTFVYWNGSEHTDEARLRNFPIQPELARKLVIGQNGKVESSRVGSEMSEDALSWNVFVGLAAAGKLRKTVEFLTKRKVNAEPQLFLWGVRVDVHGSNSGRFAPLERVRKLLEHDIGYYKTEPDIMLVVPGELIVCIEAKFGSGNPLAHESNVKVGDKPTERAGLLERYLGTKSVNALRVIDAGKIGDEFHSQLFRNVVFASEMAEGAEWHVVNLVSSSQWDGEESSSSHSFETSAASVRAYLREGHAGRFDFRTWEQMHAALIMGDSTLSTLDRYMRTKSAHFRRAFTL